MLAPHLAERDGQQLQVGPGERAIPGDCGHLEPRHSGLDEVGEDALERRRADSRLPRLTYGVAAADVDRDRDPVAAVSGDRRGGEARIRERRRSDHDSVRTGREHSRDRVGRPQAPTDLDARATTDRSDQARDDRSMHRCSRSGPVKVHDMQPGHPLLDELNRDIDRVVPIRSLAGEVALAQTDDPTTPKVNRRQQVECCQPLPHRANVLLRYNANTVEHTGPRGSFARSSPPATDQGGTSLTDDWRTEDAEALIDALLGLEDRDEAERFLRDLLTLGELRDLSLRWTVARLLDQGLHYAEISQRTGASTATITRIASWLHHGEGGYRLALDKLRKAGTLPYPTGSVEH